MKLAMLLLSVAVLIVSFTVFAGAELTAVVQTAYGPVQGQIQSTVNSVEYATFLGIPYAKPPLGELRFKPPVAVDEWTTTLNATVDGDDCPQVDSTTGNVEGSEDCLFLNVMTPVTNLTETPTELKSVMVWIHGGGFLSGTSASTTYHPDYFIEKDVVYVGFNYRLGPLGFLCLNHPNATGNAGLKDQVFALKWIQTNIRNFGGNPNNVTIFGQSAGGISVGSHVISDASAGLFHGGIAMSGMPLGLGVYQTPAAAVAVGELLGTTLGANSTNIDDILEVLREAPFEDVITTATAMSALYTAFPPTVEDASIATDPFLTQCTLIKYITGKFNQVPVMLGFTSQEPVTFFAPLAPIITMLSGIIDTFTVYRSEWPQKLVDANDIINSWTGGDLDTDQLQTLINVTNDMAYKATIDINQRLLAVYNDKPTYYYQFSYVTSVMLHNVIENNTLPGAGHADDLGFLFYYPALNYSTDPTDSSRITIDRMTTMYTNFAKYSDPTPNWREDNSLGVTWPNSGLAGTILDIGTNLTVQSRPIDEVVKFVQLETWSLLSEANGCHA